MRTEYECTQCETVVGNVIRDQYGFIKKMSKGLWKAEPDPGDGTYRKVVCASCGNDVIGREIN